MAPRTLTLEERFRRVLEHEIRNPDQQDLVTITEAGNTDIDRVQRLIVQLVMKDCLTGLTAGAPFGPWKIGADGSLSNGFDPDLTIAERMRRVIMLRYQHRLRSFHMGCKSLTDEETADAIAVLDVLKDCAEDWGNELYQKWTISENGEIHWLD